MSKKIDVEDLAAALIGYQHEEERIQSRIAEIRARLEGTSSVKQRGRPRKNIPPIKKRGPMSPEGKAPIVAALALRRLVKKVGADGPGVAAARKRVEDAKEANKKKKKK